jgi:hypothetical protein
VNKPLSKSLSQPICFNEHSGSYVQVRQVLRTTDFDVADVQIRNRSRRLMLATIGHIYVCSSKDQAMLRHRGEDSANLSLCIYYSLHIQGTARQTTSRHVITLCSSDNLLSYSPVLIIKTLASSVHHISLRAISPKFEVDSHSSLSM